MKAIPHPLEGKLSQPQRFLFWIEEKRKSWITNYTNNPRAETRERKNPPYLL
jgi:hypothetical protein